MLPRSRSEGGTPAVRKPLVSVVHSGEYSTLEVAELFGFGRSTDYRAIERQPVEARAGLAEATSTL